MVLGIDSSEYQAFLEAVKYGQLEQVEQYLVEHPEFLDLAGEYGIRPLHCAAENDPGFTTMELILERGGTTLSPPTNFWRPPTPLHFAAGNGYDSMVKLLLRYGSTSLDSPNNNGQIPLHLVAWNGYDSTAELLLEHGTSLEFTDNDGQTPLHYAAWSGRDSMVELLLRNGSTSLDLPDNDGCTPLRLAASSRRRLDPTIRILKSVGATFPTFDGLRDESIAILQEAIPEKEVLEIRHRISFVRTLTKRLLYFC